MQGQLAPLAALLIVAFAPVATADHYRIVSVSGEPAIEGQILELTDERLSGFGGCNDFEAEIRLARPVIDWLEPLRVTDRNCGADLRAAEARLFATLDRAVGYRFELGGTQIRFIGRSARTDVLAERLED